MSAEKEPNWIWMGISSGVFFAVFWTIAMGVMSGDWSQIIPIGIGAGICFGILFTLGMYLKQRWVTASSKNERDEDGGI